MNLGFQYVGTALPPHSLSQGDVKALGRKLLKGRVPFLERTLSLFDHAGVEERRTCVPLDDLFENDSLKWRNDQYIKACKAMAHQLLDRFFSEHSLLPSDIDAFITTSCTGFMIPSIDAYCINTFGMRPDTIRMPLTELGCAAGAMACSRARDLIMARPGSNVLVMALEFPSLTYQTKDFRMANVVSCALFGDGGSLALLQGCNNPKVRIIDSLGHFFPKTEHAMGFDLRDSGFQILLDKEISGMIGKSIHPLCEQILSKHGFKLSDAKHFVFHPGGRKIMDEIQKGLDLDANALAASRNVLKKAGNLSSASVFWVLHETLKQSPKGLGLMGAFGPGFQAELLLVEFL